MSLSKGLRYEQLAEQYLVKQGLTVVERNYRCRGGEIDLLMLDREYLCCIEVKYRHDNAFGGTAHSIPKTKQKKIIQTALHFIAAHAEHQQRALRFDALLIQPQKESDQLEMEWLQSAFAAEGYY